MRVLLLKITAYVCILLPTVSSNALAVGFDKLTIMTEDYPPYNYVENNQPMGKAVDLLLKATKAVGNPINKDQIRVTAWARAYQTAKSGPNTILFSTTRTEERENLFKWAGPIDEIRIVLIAKKSTGITNVAPQNINVDVGVVRDDIGDHLSVSAGVPDSVIKRNSKPDGMAKMLATDRIKAWAYPERTAFKHLKSIGENIDDYEVIHVLKASSLYFAFSKDVDDAIVAKLQQGINMVNK
jgi:ABC-type amino acid transport substrate-binding protein